MSKHIAALTSDVMVVILAVLALIALACSSAPAAEGAKDDVTARRRAVSTQVNPISKPIIPPTDQAQVTVTSRADSVAAILQALLAGETVLESAAPTAGEEINWSVVGAGGLTGTSTNWIVSGTVGQTAVGSATSTNYVDLHGFWQDFGLSGPSCCVGIVGDANGDGDVEPSIGDIAVVIDAKYISMTCDVIACLPEADANQSGGATPTCEDISIGDIAILIDYLFITGPELGLPNCM